MTAAAGLAMLTSLASFVVAAIAVRIALTANANLRLTRAALIDTHARLIQTRAILATANDALMATDRFLASLDPDIDAKPASSPKVH